MTLNIPSVRSTRGKERNVWSLEESDECHPGDKASNMGEECDPTTRTAQAYPSAEELQHKPHPKHDSGCDLRYPQTWHQHEHVCAGKQQHICAQHARNRPAGPYHRNGR